MEQKAGQQRKRGYQNLSLGNVIFEINLNKTKKRIRNYNIRLELEMDEIKKCYSKEEIKMQLTEYSTSGNIIVSYILIFKFLDRNR
jgi:hypothetical protein